MKRLNNSFKLLFLLLFLFLISGTGCATQNPWLKKRSKGSHVNTSQLGRNKYYFSVGYQKKISKSSKRK